MNFHSKRFNWTIKHKCSNNALIYRHMEERFTKDKFH